MRRRPAPIVQVYANFQDKSSIGYVADKVTDHLYSAIGAQAAACCTTGQQAQRIACQQRKAPDADVGVYIGFPREVEGLLWNHRHFVGVYVCEGDVVPYHWVRICNQHSAIVVPSQFVKDAFTDSGVVVPIFVVPHGISAEYNRMDVPKLPGFAFLSVFNANPFLARKGVTELVTAFHQLHSERPDVNLVMKTNASPMIEGWRNIEGIQIVTARYGVQQLAELYARAHAHVHPTRSEGFGITPLESLACGTPVVVPYHSGLLEFIDPERDCIIETTGNKEPFPTYDNPSGCLYEMRADDVYVAMKDMVDNHARYVEQAKTFDRSKWTWDAALRELPAVIEKVRSFPARVKPAPVYVPTPAGVPDPTSGPSRQVFPPFVAKRKNAAGPDHLRMYMGPQQRRAYDDDPSGLGTVIQELTARIPTTCEQDGLLIAPYNPEHCRFEALAQKANVVAFTTFESDRWPEWWVKDLNHCMMVVVPQPWVRRSLRTSGCTVPIEVVPQAFKVQKPPRRSKKKGQPYTFGFLGVPVVRKNLELLVDALPDAAALRVHAAWMPRGAENVSDPRVKVTSGKWDDARLHREFWSQIDCLVVPSAGEGYSMVAREAIAMGIPTIVSDIPAHEDIHCTKTPLRGQEDAWYEFCGQRIGMWGDVDPDALKTQLEAATKGFLDIATEDQTCPDHSWDATVKQLREVTDYSVVTFTPAEAPGGGIDRFARKMASAWPGLKCITDVDDLKHFGPAVRWLILQFEYGLCSEAVLNELRDLKAQYKFKVLALVHSANDGAQSRGQNRALQALSDRIVLLNKAQSSVFGSGIPAEHPWPEPGEYHETTGKALGNHGNIHPQKGYQHLFALAKRMRRPVSIAGPLDLSNQDISRVYHDNVKPNIRPKDSMRFEFVPDAELMEAMGQCAALVYPYEPWVNIQASGAVRTAIEFGRPIICSDHREYFDLPECFPSLHLDDDVATQAAVVRQTVKDARKVFEDQAAYARSRGWKWFVRLVKRSMKGDAVIRRRPLPLFLIVGQTLGLGGAEKVTVDVANALQRSGIYRVQLAMALTAKGIYAAEVDPSIEVFETTTASILVQHVAKHRPNGILINNSVMPKPVTAALMSHGADYYGIMLHGYVKWSLDILPHPFPPNAHIVAVSDEVKQGIIRARQDVSDAQVTVIRNAVDTDRFCPPKSKADVAALPWGDDHGPIFGYAGRFSAEKALPTMVAVFAKARQRLPGAKLLMVGGADPGGIPEHVNAWNINRGIFNRAVRAHDVQNDVHVTGVVEDPERWYRSMDVLLLTSHFEGLPLVAMEAMASGVPVVSTAVGAVPDLLSSGGGLAIESGRGDMPPAAMEEFVDQMVSAASAPGQMGVKGRKRIVEDFSMQTYRRFVVEYATAHVAPLKPRVAVLYDIEGWAFHFIACEIEKGMAGASVQLVKYSDLSPGSLRDVDVVYNPSYVYTESILAAIRPGIPLVSTCADHFTWKTPEGKLKMEEAISASYTLICTNKELANEVSEMFPHASISICMSGVDADLFTPGNRQNERPGKIVVGWAGSTQFHIDIKGVDIIRDACAEVAGVELLIADSQERLRTKEQMVQFYRTLDVYVCMSSSEGTGMPLLEAMACGVPIISTDVGVAAALVSGSGGSSGQIVERTHEGLMGAIRWCTEHRKELLKQGKAARFTIEQDGWEWAQRAQKYRKVIIEALEGIR